MGDTDRGGDRAAVPLRGKKTDTVTLRVKNRQHCVSVSGKWLFYEETKRRLRSGSVYPSCHTNLVKRRFISRNLRFGSVLNLARMRVSVV